MRRRTGKIVSVEVGVVGGARPTDRGDESQVEKVKGGQREAYSASNTLEEKLYTNRLWIEIILAISHVDVSGDCRAGVSDNISNCTKLTGGRIRSTG